MATQLSWLGHGSWLIQTGEHRIILDPFLNESPTAPIKADDVDVSFILVSHGHFDHVADVAEIANRTEATVVANYEICEWFSTNHQVQNTIGMNLGGGIKMPFGHLKMTVAHHSSQLPDGSYGGNPGGFLLEFDDGRIYFACDTALFGDMKMIGDTGVDLAVLPIGDHFTMGPDDALEAVKLIRPKRVAPAHYNTWPPIEQDPNAWAEKIREETDSWPIIPVAGEPFTIS